MAPIMPLDAPRGTPPDQTIEALARIDGCPEACGNTEAPYRVEMETATSWTGFYRCADCGVPWQTGWAQ